MSVTLYVGNISYSMKEDELKSAFGQFGEVESVKIIIDKRTGKSKGYGFVEMGSDAAAEEALNGMNGKELMQRLFLKYPHIRCIFISGYTADVIAHQGKLDARVSLLQKPFTNQALTHKVREVLDRHEGSSTWEIGAD